MSLSFPASPTDGQLYQSWIFNAAKGVWAPNLAAQMVTSINGQKGDLGPTVVPGYGQLVRLSNQVVSSPVAFVAFTGITGAYDEYEIRFHSVRGGGDQNLMLGYSADNGATWNAGLTCTHASTIGASNGTPTGTGSGGAVGVLISPPIYNNSNVFGAHGFTRFSNPASSVFSKTFFGLATSISLGNIQYSGAFGGQVAAIFNAVRVICSGASNITDGNFSLYGVVK